MVNEAMDKLNSLLRLYLSVNDKRGANEPPFKDKNIILLTI